jgi:hypothetical protein
MPAQIGATVMLTYDLYSGRPDPAGSVLIPPDEPVYPCAWTSRDRRPPR